MKPIATLALLAAAALLPAPPAEGQDAPAAAAEGNAALADAAKAFAEGRYGDAEARFRRLLDAGGGDAAALSGLARLLEETGRIPEALATARKARAKAPDDTETRILVGRLEAASGDFEAAARSLGEAVAGSASSARARAALGDLFRGTGKRKEALEAYLSADALWGRGQADAPEEVVAVARARLAAQELDRGYRGQLASSLDLLGEPLRKKLPEAILLLADVYVRHDETGRITKALEPLLARNPNHPDALAIQARAKERRFESEDAAELARRALAVNPSHTGAIEVLAVLRYGDGHEKGAEEIVRRGLEARPAEPSLLALDAVRHYLSGDLAAFEEGMKKALAVDPTFGRGFDFVARVLEDRRRFAEAVEMARRAVKIDPGDPEGWFSLGRNLLNLGREKEAREAIEKSDKADPWHDIFRSNFALVLDKLDGYASGTTKHFVLRMDGAEEPALRPLYERALESSYEALRARYGFEPETPILVEVFRSPGDFSARTSGIPGIGLVGACFGKVVTLDSPGALPPGAFSWRSTAHHEIAHVFHLQMTRGRVPRWFTEGLAVHEESVARPSWVRVMDRDLVSALANGEVKGLLSIDAAFRTNVMWAYYQAGLMCGWLDREFGWEKVLEMLRLYGQDKDNAAAVRAALGLEPAEFDARFLDWCRRKTEGWSVRPRWSKAKTEEFRRASEKDPKALEAHLLLAEACLQQDKGIDAGTALARAKAVAPDDPFLVELRGWLALASLRNPDRGLELLREALAKGRDHFDLRMRLAQAAEKAGRNEEALEHYRRAKFHFPRAVGKEDPRPEIARILMGLGDAEGATREAEERILLDETEIPARLSLAESYESRGDPEKAAEVLRDLVEISPLPGQDRRNPFPAADVHARLGRALATIDRAGDAADAFRVAVAVGRGWDPKPDAETIAKWLVEQAKAARRAGRTAEAKAALQDALRTDPRNAEASEMLRDLGGS